MAHEKILVGKHMVILTEVPKNSRSSLPAFGRPDSGESREDVVEGFTGSGNPGASDAFIR